MQRETLLEHDLSNIESVKERPGQRLPTHSVTTTHEKYSLVSVKSQTSNMNEASPKKFYIPIAAHIHTERHTHTYSFRKPFPKRKCKKQSNKTDTFTP